MLRSSTALTSVLTLLLLASLSHTADAQVVPHHATGTNALFDSSDGSYAGEGIGTHLGRHTIEGFVVPDVTSDLDNGIFLQGTFWGLQTVTAANGDTLDMYLEGSVLLVVTEEGLVTGEWYPEFTIIGGSGRFENASGSLSGIAYNPPFDPFASPVWPFDWVIGDTIDLGRKGPKNK